MAKYTSEFSGTMFLIAFIKLAVVYDSYTTSLSIGLGLGLIIYNYGYISGAHVNPAVTLAIMIRDIPAFPLSDKGQIIMYFISQYLGGMFGGIIATIIGILYTNNILYIISLHFLCIQYTKNQHNYNTKQKGGDKAAAVYPTVFKSEDDIGDGYLLFQAFIGETFFTYLLCSTVLHVATDKRQSKNQFYGLAIGLSLSLGIACIGPISGCCLNTSVWLGTVIPAIITNQIPYGLGDAWVYWAATFLGIFFFFFFLV